MTEEDHHCDLCSKAFSVGELQILNPRSLDVLCPDCYQEFERWVKEIRTHNCEKKIK